MNYSGIIYGDTANGPGNRLTLFVSGCPHKCYKCFNSYTWDKHYGNEFTENVEDEFIAYFQRNEKYLNGLSLLGGEPLAHYNVDKIIGIASRFKSIFPHKDIWLWTGYTLEEVLSDLNKAKILKYIDVLIDGKYEDSKKNHNLKYRGSHNQRMYNIIDSIPVLID